MSVLITSSKENNFAFLSRRTISRSEEGERFGVLS